VIPVFTQVKLIRRSLVVIVVGRYLSILGGKYELNCPVCGKYMKKVDTWTIYPLTECESVEFRCRCGMVVKVEDEKK